MMAWVPLLHACSLLGVLAAVMGVRQLPNPEPPVFPDVYEVEYYFSLPYVKATQGGDLREVVHLWYNGTSGSSRIEYYGIDSTLTTKDAVYISTPRINETICYSWDLGQGPSSLHEGPWTTPNSKHSLLPDLSTWNFGGKVNLKGKDVLVYKRQHKVEERVDAYTFYVTEDGVPVAFHTLGAESFSNAHIDEYLYEFTYFGSGSFRDPDALAPPAKCDDASTFSHTPKLPHFTHTTSAREHSYQLWLVQHGKVTQTPEEYEQGLASFTETAQMVQQHNAGDGDFRMDANHLADMPHEQFLSRMLPMKLKREAFSSDEELLEAKKKTFGFQSLGVMKKTLGRKKLPLNVDWRGTGAVGASKDQATCGSCWAFAAVGALEGAWFLATGRQTSFSEQQLVDCSWNYAGSMGCDGGWYEGGIQYVAENGGAVMEEDYQYTGQNGFCRDANATKSGVFKGYLEVPPRDEEALMEALYKYGPVAVSVDAEWPTFRYYSEGLYVEKRCKSGARYLDHAVLLVGYGTDHNGQEYWLIRNSWAKYFGNDGYMKIPRWHDCGVATDPVVAVVADEYVVPGVREKWQRLAEGRPVGQAAAEVAV